jgi:acetyl esterase
MQAILDRMKAAGWRPSHTLSVAEARRVFKSHIATGALVPRTKDRVIPGPAGDIPVRIHWPAGPGPFPALVFFHGGGWVVGNLDTHDVTCRSLTNQAGCVTVSVDYRLAPEHKFPAAVEDAYAATRWVVDHAAALERAGVAATFTRYDGVTHGFVGMETVLDKGRAAVAESAQALRAAFGQR